MPQVERLVSGYFIYMTGPVGPFVLWLYDSGLLVNAPHPRAYVFAAGLRGSAIFPIETKRERRQCDEPIAWTTENCRKTKCDHGSWRRCVRPRHHEKCVGDVRNRRDEQCDNANQGALDVNHLQKR